MRTWLTVADNSGGRKLTCIMPVGGDAGLKAGLGDVITAAVKEATPESQVKKGSVVKAVVVRMRKERRHYHRFHHASFFDLAFWCRFLYRGGHKSEEHT